jgi:hypothetical protein
MGTPQGSPISPVLSIIYASPLLHLAKRWTDAAYMMFVDDGNIFVRAPSYQLLALKFRDLYSECHNWCLRAGLTIEPEKTEVLFFSHPWHNLALHGACPKMVYLPDWGSNTYYTVAATDHV